MVGEAAGAVVPHLWDLWEQTSEPRPIIVEKGVEEAEMLEIEVYWTEVCAAYIRWLIVPHPRDFASNAT